VEMYGTCSAQAADVVKQLGAIPIDYRNSDFVQEIHRLTGDALNVVFDGIGGDNLWRSRQALSEGGRVVVYGFQSKLRGGRMASDAPSGRHPVRESAILGWYIIRNWFRPGRNVILVNRQFHSLTKICSTSRSSIVMSFEACVLRG
jgi:NADPH2:quinone reductase